MAGCTETTMASIIPSPPPARFVAQRSRPQVTGEPERRSPGWDPRFPDVDWIGSAQQGGGRVPEDFEWKSNPKQHQDDLMGEWPHP
jgi:hypothetical protein